MLNVPIFFIQIQYVETVSCVVVFWLYLILNVAVLIQKSKNDSNILRADGAILFWKHLRE